MEQQFRSTHGYNEILLQVTCIITNTPEQKLQGPANQRVSSQDRHCSLF